MIFSPVKDGTIVIHDENLTLDDGNYNGRECSIDVKKCLKENMKKNTLHCFGVGRIKDTPKWVCKQGRHKHAHVELIVMFGGQLSVTVGDQVLSANTGDVLFYPPGTVHLEQGTGTRPLDFIFFVFHGGPASGPVLTHDQEGKIRVLANWMLQEQSSAYARKRDVIDATLAALLAEFEKAVASQSQPHPLVKSVDSFLRDHLPEPVTVMDIARHVHMSRFHFLHSYKQITGQSPMAVLRLMRVEAARDKIITTRLPLKQIAMETSFYDEYHLAHTFQKLLGVPPSYFRKQ